MTPFELTLHNDLDVERQRFGNEWTFQWHKLRMEGKMVDVESFDGGRIRLGGIEFGYQQQCIFWQAIGRYLKGKVHETFRKWDEETKHYPPAARRSSLEGAGRELRVFIAGVNKNAKRTDRALRGKNGVPSTDRSDLETDMHAGADAEVAQLLYAHTILLPSDQANPIAAAAKSPSVKDRWEKWYGENKGTTWAIGIVTGILLFLGKAFLF